MLLEFIGILALVGVLAKLLGLKYQHWKYSHLPGPKRESFIYGNAREFRKRMIDEGCWGAYWLDQCREHGLIFQFWMVMRPRVFVADPLVIKEMVTDFKLFPRPDFSVNFFTKNLSFSIARIGTQNFCGFNSLLTDHGGPIWKRKKKIMDPAFSIQRLTMHLSRFVDISMTLADYIEAAQQETPGKPLDLHAIMSLFTIDAISRAGFSATADQAQELRSHNTNMGAAMTTIMSKGGNALSLIMDPKSRKTLSAVMRDLKTIRKLGKDLIIARTSNGTFGQVHDILDCVISANMDETTGKLEVEESLDDFMTMYAAGVGTTNTTVLWVLAELTRNPDVMEKLVAEVDSIWVGEDIDCNTETSVIGDTLKKMTYLEAVVKETLRYHPPVQIIIRKSARNVNLCGYDVPAGTMLSSSQYVLHRWEKYWPDPDKFDPERFINSTPKPYTYIPFFLGPRQCIGKNFAILELKCILCEVLKRFEVEKDPDTAWKIRSRQGILCCAIENRYIVKPRL